MYLQSLALITGYSYEYGYDTHNNTDVMFVSV